MTDGCVIVHGGVRRYLGARVVPRASSRGQPVCNTRGHVMRRMLRLNLVLFLLAAGCGDDTTDELQILKQQQESLRELSKREKEVLELEKGLEDKQREFDADCAVKTGELARKESNLKAIEQEQENRQVEIDRRSQDLKREISENEKALAQLKEIQDDLAFRDKLVSERAQEIHEFALATVERWQQRHNSYVAASASIPDAAERTLLSQYPLIEYELREKQYPLGNLDLPALDPAFLKKMDEQALEAEYRRQRDEYQARREQLKVKHLEEPVVSKAFYIANRLTEPLTGEDLKTLYDALSQYLLSEEVAGIRDDQAFDKAMKDTIHGMEDRAMKFGIDFATLKDKTAITEANQ